MTSAFSGGSLQDVTGLVLERNPDVTITTQDCSYEVRKDTLSLFSKVLVDMCNSGSRETSTSTLVLQDDDPATVDRMLTFFYRGDYDDGSAALNGADAEADVEAIFMANCLVIAIAEKYEIEVLKTLANTKFQKVVDYCTTWESDNFFNVVLGIFNTTPDRFLDLKSAMISICARHMDEILASEAWNRLLAENSAIGLAFLKVAYQRFWDKYTETTKKLEHAEAELVETKALLSSREKKLEQVSAELVETKALLSRAS